MNFWIIAVALLVIPAVVISWPFLTGSNRERMLGIWVLVMMPLAGLLIYHQIGEPKAINQPPAIAAQQNTAQQNGTQQAHDSQQAQMDELVANLQQRMTENPDDPEGWMILGRSLKTMQRYDEAKTALENAYRLSPDNPLVMVELAEASLFASGQAEVSNDIRQLLESALEIDPQQQKALWILGMAAAQNGDDEQAVATWEKLLDQLEPGSGPAQAVSQQIEMASSRMGISPPQMPPEQPQPQPQPQPQVTNTGVNIPISIRLGNEQTGSLPATAVVFVFIHPKDGAGMPLAVKRIARPALPLSLTLSDSDLLQPGTSLADFELLDISARISMSGVANASTGDIQAERITVDTKAITEIALTLDQGVP